MPKMEVLISDIMKRQENACQILDLCLPTYSHTCGSAKNFLLGVVTIPKIIYCSGMPKEAKLRIDRLLKIKLGHQIVASAQGQKKTFEHSQETPWPN